MHEVVDSLELLKSLEEAVKDPAKILTKDTPNPLTNTKNREALTLFLTAVALNKSYEEQGNSIHIDVCKNDKESDSLDGYLKVKYPDGTEEELEFEQVMLTVEEIKTTNSQTDISDLVIEKIKQKHDKGYDNPKGVTLVVFLDIRGKLIPKKVKNYIKDNNFFLFYIIIVLDPEGKKEGSYVYKVVDLNPEREGNHSRLTVRINRDFSGYEVNLDEEV